jgi:hypothetical protein
MSVPAEQFEARYQTLAGAEAEGGSAAEGRGQYLRQRLLSTKATTAATTQKMLVGCCQERARARQDLRVLQDFETAASNALYGVIHSYNTQQQ